MNKRSFIFLSLIACVWTSFALAGDDPVVSFKNGIARLEERKNDIFVVGGNPHIRFDVKKTDSLVSPIIGIVAVEAGDPELGAIDHEFRFSYNAGKWTLDKYLWRLSDGPWRDMPLKGMVAPQVQACFQ